jgi:hypothetical protein
MTTHIPPTRNRDEELAPNGWSKAFVLTGHDVPPFPSTWPFFQVSIDVRIRLFDALNFVVEERRKTKKGGHVWNTVAYVDTWDKAVASAKRRYGLTAFMTIRKPDVKLPRALV